MALSIGTTKQGNFTGPGAGTTVDITSVTQDSGSDGYLYFTMLHQNSPTPTGVTYDGDSMTLINTYTAQGVNFRTYELANPSTGSNTLTVTYDPFQEYGTQISYWIISTTGCAGYGNIQEATGAASGPGGLDCNISSISSGSAVVLIATIPTPTSYNQTLTVDGSTRDYDSGGNTTPFIQFTGTSNTSTGWYVQDASTGDTNMLSDSSFQMGGTAIEITEAAAAPGGGGTRQRVFIIS